MAYPSRLWLQAAPKGAPQKCSRLGGDGLVVGKKWGWKCRCEWSQIEDDAEADPESEAGKLWASLLKKFHDLPKENGLSFGCGQGFIQCLPHWTIVGGGDRHEKPDDRQG